ncbi:DNA polymerase-3 subunit gamma/tau [Deinobacterium chartae]|uniref:DNA polymerase III subunit gamma/tau n=1 Tax=Deinobacterium chartae TaxID=521158 RepID=A0A841I1H2_9DEIO|nr:DNA polymerase-3 subunit gamma/tau [Deinobacterium chartae]
MSAIYQKSRPLHWEEVVGQEHVRDVLTAALARGRVGHAYLFSGPRGVGKTTTARLIAMTVNCEGSGTKPCGVCASCQLIISGAHPDVVEIDAASNNSVDDVRDLREKVALSSMRGGRKVYILDEAHMMSRGAFNALLKTLEEPPEHVLFILATTEPEKILPTILSRCQHYRFRRLSDAEIASKLERICAREGVAFESPALALIGRLADGAMRDGESLLERMLASGEPVTLAAVEAALGLPPGERMRAIAEGLEAGQAESVLGEAGRLYREGFAARSVVDGVKVALRERLHAQLGLSDAPAPGADVPQLLRLLAALDEQDARFVRQGDLMALELALTQALLAGQAQAGPISAAAAPAASAAAVPGDLLRRLSKLEADLAALRAGGAPVRAATGNAVTDFDPGRRPPASRPASADAPPRAPADAAPATAAPGVRMQGSWADVARLAPPQLRAFFKPARPELQLEAGRVALHFDERSKFHATQTLAKFDEVAALVEQVFGAVEFEVITAEGSKKKHVSGGARLSAPSPAAATAAARADSRTAAPEPARAAVQAAVREVAVPAAATPPASSPPVPPASDAPRKPASRNADFFERPSRPAAAARTAEADAAPQPAPWDDAPAPAEPPMTSPLSADPRSAPEPYIPGEPLDAPPVFEEIPLSSWDELGTAAPSRPTARPEPTELPQTDASESDAPAARGAASGVRAHPLFEDLGRLFPHRVREMGQLRSRNPGDSGDEDSDETAENEDEA